MDFDKDGLREMVKRLYQTLDDRNIPAPHPVLAALAHVADEFDHMLVSAERVGVDTNWSVRACTKTVFVDLTAKVLGNGSAPDLRVSIRRLSDITHVEIDDVTVSEDFGDYESRAQWTVHFRHYEDDPVTITTHGQGSSKAREAAESFAQALLASVTGPAAVTP